MNETAEIEQASSLLADHKKFDCTCRICGQVESCQTLMANIILSGRTHTLIKSSAASELFSLERPHRYAITSQLTAPGDTQTSLNWVCQQHKAGPFRPPFMFSDLNIVTALLGSHASDDLIDFPLSDDL